MLAPRRLAWIEEPIRPPGPGEVLVGTSTGAVSIGSELPQYEGTARSGALPTYPRMTGYESLGVVEACGAGVARPVVGERVVAFYGHRTHAVVPAAKAIPVPDGVSEALALLVILTCDVAKGVRRLAVRPEEPVLVVGGGAIGLLAVWVLRAYGGWGRGGRWPRRSSRRPRAGRTRRRWSARRGTRALRSRRWRCARSDGCACSVTATARG